jgi:putative lipoic acid-binding regulatory protein
MTEDSLLSFPCDVPIKVFGRNSAEFRATTLDILRGHWSDIADSEVAERTSRGGTYLSLTITVHAESRDQIDAAYRELTSSDQILMVL